MPFCIKNSDKINDLKDNNLFSKLNSENAIVDEKNNNKSMQNNSISYPKENNNSESEKIPKYPSSNFSLKNINNKYNSKEFDNNYFDNKSKDGDRDLPLNNNKKSEICYSSTSSNLSSSGKVSKNMIKSIRDIEKSPNPTSSYFKKILKSQNENIPMSNSEFKSNK